MNAVMVEHIEQFIVHLKIINDFLLMSKMTEIFLTQFNQTPIIKTMSKSK